MFGKWSDSKIHPESPNIPKTSMGGNIERSKSAPKRNLVSNVGCFTLFREGTYNPQFFLSLSSTLQMKKQSTIPAVNTLYSFEPELICESEERERITALSQREFLIKSYGMLEQIYMAMKRNGTLRAVDERKYGLYGRLGYEDNASKSANGCGHKCQRHHHIGLETINSSQYCLKASKIDAVR